MLSRNSLLLFIIISFGWAQEGIHKTIDKFLRPPLQSSQRTSTECGLQA
jgi:hypothetical protein